MLHIIAKLKEIGGAVERLGTETSDSSKVNEQNSALRGKLRGGLFRKVLDLGNRIGEYWGNDF